MFGLKIREDWSCKNIVLFGIDARDDAFDKATRSDTIVIISINNDTGAVRMASVYRDTYLKITGSDNSSSYEKVNAAYSKGGAQAALSTLDTPTINGASLVVPARLSGNVTALHEFLFDDSDYKPTKKVDAISKKIIEKTGIQPITPDLEQNEK